jgi:hypothetical protein
VALSETHAEKICKVMDMAWRKMIGPIQVAHVFKKGCALWGMLIFFIETYKQVA